jgi:hypothetical protein
MNILLTYVEKLYIIISAVSKAKIINRDANQSIFSFISQPQSTRGASEALKITQPTEHSRMDYDAT